MHGGKLASLISASCLAVASAGAEPVSVYWSDGDSGVLTLPMSNGKIPFRLHGVDAPETGAVGTPRGAKCESERELGFAAKAAAVVFTKAFGDLDISASYGLDQYQRLVIDLSADGRDVASALLEDDLLKPWDYDGGQRKPSWCFAK